ncbi:FAD-dependent oxidoreductase [Hymenobacter busanensis]|uniref:FAD-dependent oxidoreductase n=1 Tax=Hymenobacter busanensis TaxID=2607656 RepID=A0A7L5A129_9BACT|nr:FAD-dependent oxidoreductase [Hymenobacter busanensis]KAA9338594.1 FAD-dependent oxidoreductase [Hymenobacter busanensis]QHJ08977.1 FAD-dependent oxidoreductase [Hymenobacter busanensis]
MLTPDQSSGATPTAWLATADRPTFAVLSQNTTADVVVIGAGIAGLSTAYLLAREGRTVVVLEDGEIGSGETGRTTAHLSNALDDRYYNLEKLFGQEGARLAADSHGAAIDQIERIAREENIACDFARLDGFLFLPAGGTVKELDDELAAAHRAGLGGVERLPDARATGFHTGDCLRFPNQGQFHILKYLNGLAQALVKRGGRIFTHTRATEIHVIDQDVRVVTQGGAEVAAKHVVVATNTPFNDRVVMHTKQAPYRTYVVAVRVPKGSVTQALYWDTADPYHYIRLQEMPDSTSSGSAYDLLIVGGEDHKTGQESDPEERLRCLEEWTRKHFPSAQQTEFRWSGQVMEPVDSLGYAGRNPMDADNVYIITGDSGHGMTHSTLGAMLITDLIQGRDNPWEKLYDPGRITGSLDTAKEFLKENLNVAAEYTDLLTGGDVASAEEIAPDTGAVLRRGLAKVAVYRDPQGQQHECSAICPHLGCVVHWNNLEKSWDCPCHGSRFSAYGELMNGPADRGLGKVE